MEIAKLKTIGLVVGETSGDLLGGDLVRGLSKKYPHIRFIGIGGDILTKAGMECKFHYSTLAVMGISAVIMRIIPIVKLFFQIKHLFLKEKIDLFISIDAPDFNLKLSKQLKKHNIPCIHYVSPSFWAWRPKFIHKIMKSTDMVMCLFPFEKALYEAYNYPAYFVGHPLAKNIDTTTSISLPKHKTFYGIIPGSRNSELKYNLEELVKTASKIEKNDDTAFIIFNMIKKEQQTHLLELIETSGINNYHIQCGKAIDTINAADYIITKSGTVSLEVALHLKPHIIMYKYSKLNDFLVKLFRINVKFMGIINWLYGSKLVPEFRQSEATAENMAKTIIKIKNNHTLQKNQIDFFVDIREKLKNGEVSTTEAIENFVGKI